MSLPAMRRERAEHLRSTAIALAEENDREKNPLFTPAPVCMSTFEAAVVAGDVLDSLDEIEQAVGHIRALLPFADQAVGQEGATMRARRFLNGLPDPTSVPQSEGR